LFTYFEQVGGKHAHHMKGSGVGLALTRALVEGQGGSISVRSAVGHGSSFDVHLVVAP
jgi:signal transduction histidine kinase